MRIAAVWLVGALCWAGFVAFTSIGPVVYSLGWRHGVHATDLLVGAVVVGLAARATADELSARRHRSRSGERRDAGAAPRADRA